MLRVVMWSTDPVGKQMAGPGIRYHRLAIELAQRFEVTLVAPGEGIPAMPYTFRPAESVSSASDVEADVVVAQSLPLGLIRSLHRAGVRLVFDLYAPALVEAAANLAGEQSADRSDGIRYEEVVAIDAGCTPARRRISSAPATGSAITGWERSPVWVASRRTSTPRPGAAVARRRRAVRARPVTAAAPGHLW